MNATVFLQEFKSSDKVGATPLQMKNKDFVAPVAFIKQMLLFYGGL